MIGCRWHRYRLTVQLVRLIVKTIDELGWYHEVTLVPWIGVFLFSKGEKYG